MGSRFAPSRSFLYLIRYFILFYFTHNFFLLNYLAHNDFVPLPHSRDYCRQESSKRPRGGTSCAFSRLTDLRHSFTDIRALVINFSIKCILKVAQIFMIMSLIDQIQIIYKFSKIFTLLHCIRFWYNLSRKITIITRN